MALSHPSLAENRVKNMKPSQEHGRPMSKEHGRVPAHRLTVLLGMGRVPPVFLVLSLHNARLAHVTSHNCVVCTGLGPINTLFCPFVDQVGFEVTFVRLA